MKKALPVILFFSLASMGYADFKIMGGFNLSKYRVSGGNEELEWNNKPGFAAGLGFERNLNPLLLVEFNVLYFKKGSKVKSAADASQWTYNLNVVSVPVLFRSKFLYDSSPYVVAGVEFSFITSHQVKSGDLEPLDIKDRTQSFDFGLVFGGGFELKLQDRLFLFVEGRYQLGIRNIVNDPSDPQSRKTKALLILVGVRS